MTTINYKENNHLLESFSNKTNNFTTISIEKRQYQNMTNYEPIFNNKIKLTPPFWMTNFLDYNNMLF